MANFKNSDGKIMIHYDGVSYLCESCNHILCGGNCKCICHNKKEVNERGE